jgi:hypothetical protein
VVRRESSLKSQNEESSVSDRCNAWSCSGRESSCGSVFGVVMGVRAGDCVLWFVSGVRCGVLGDSIVLRHLKSTPNHAAFRASHAANEHARIVLDVLRNEHAGLRGAAGVRAGH